MSSTVEESGAEVLVEDTLLFMCRICSGVVTASQKSFHAKSHKKQKGQKTKKAKRTTLQPVTEVMLFGPVASSPTHNNSEPEEDAGRVLGPQPNANNDGLNNIPAVVDKILRNPPKKSSRRKTHSKKGQRIHSQVVKCQNPSRTSNLASQPRGTKSRNRQTAAAAAVRTGCSSKTMVGEKDTQKVEGTGATTTPNPASSQGWKRNLDSTPASFSSCVVPCSDPRDRSSLKRRKASAKDAQQKVRSTAGIKASNNPASTHEGRGNGLGPGDRIGLTQVHNENRYPIPLLSVHAKARVLQVIAEVVVTQVYQNKEIQPIEAIYYFPTNPEGAVTHFEAELDGRIVKGKVKPNEEAQADFDTAVKNKNSAFLGEEVEPDIFKLRVGYLRPGSQAKITIKYVTEVRNEPGSETIRFYIPTTIAPRYVSPEDEGDKKAEEMARMRFTPNCPVPLSIGVDIFLDGGIEDIESPSHKVTVSTGGLAENPSWSKAYVTLASDTTQMDRDFVLNIRPTDPHRPSLHVSQKEDGWTAAMLHFLPSFKLEEQKSELIFVLDRSGSMGGPSIELAREALRLFLHSMPLDCYFNVVGFGSTFKLLFPASAKYSDRTLKQAIKHAKGVQADLGGTELLQPLKKILNRPEVKGYLRQVFVLTDGQVENTEKVIGLVQANCRKARVFSLGIGEAASHQLVEGLAKAGGGTSAFVALSESMDAKILNQLKNALHPSIGAIQLAWEGVEPQTTPPAINNCRTLLWFNKPDESAPPKLTPLCVGNISENSQSPNQIPPLHDGSQMLVFGLFKSQIPTAVTITARAPGGPLTLRVKYPADFIETSDLVHTLAVIKLLRELELEDAQSVNSFGVENGSCSSDKAQLSQEEIQFRKQKITEIACRNELTSKYTSFVAVDQGNGLPSSESWVMMTMHHVPNELPHGWGGNYTEETSIIPLPLSTPAKAPRHRKKSPSCTMVCLIRPCSRECNGKRGYGGGGQWGREEAMKRMKNAPTALRHKSVSSSSESESDEEGVINNRGGGGAVVLRLVKHQSFDGSFASSKPLSRMIGVPITPLKILKVSSFDSYFHTLDLNASTTALAILAFETKLASLKPSWELIVRKARVWLASNIPEGLSISEVFHAASEYVNNGQTPVVVHMDEEWASTSSGGA